MSEATNNDGLCKIKVCLNKALENGYCEEHQGFAGTEENNSTDSVKSPDKTSSWQTFLNVAAFISFISGLIYGLVNLSEINELAGEFIPNSTKVKTVLVPTFLTGAFSVVILALGRIISLLEKRG